jgi:transcriptional regulator with XRE-family HTH domain
MEAGDQGEGIVNALFDELDYALHLARARRGMSQRDFADLVGLSPSRVARLERGQGLGAFAEVQRVLGSAGLRLAVVDEGAADWEPATDSWEFRDLAGRRFPAHRTAVLRRGVQTWEWGRYGGEPPPFAWSTHDPLREHRELREWSAQQDVSRRSADGSS